MLGPMLGASGGLTAAGTALLAVAGNAAEAAAAVRAGAALVEFPAAGPAAIAAFRASYPGVLVCAECDQADVVRDPATALRTGAILVCDGLPAADGAPVPRRRLLVDVPQAMVARTIAAGYAALVDLRDSPVQPPDPGPAAASPAATGAAADLA